MGGVKMINSELKASLLKTGPGRKILQKLQGESADILLGKSFFKKAGAKIKNIGKYTGKITGKIAKVAAAAVGIPPSLVDSLKRFDPTTKKKLDKALLETPAAAAAAAEIENANKAAKNKKIMIGAGIGAAALVVIVLASKKGKK